MATVDKVFVFDSTTEGLIEDGSSALVTFNWDGATGDPSAGCVNFLWTATGGTTQEEMGKTPAGGVNWESWGVPAGRTVSSVQFAAGKKELATNTLLTAISYRIELLDLSNVPITGSDLIPTTALGTTVDASFQDLAAGTVQSVVPGFDESTQLFRIFIHCTMTTTAGTPNVKQRFDTFTFRMTYNDLPGDADDLPIGLLGRGAGW